MPSTRTPGGAAIVVRGHAPASAPHARRRRPRARARHARDRRRRSRERHRRRHGRSRLRDRPVDAMHRARERVLRPMSIRRTSKRLGLKTEASIRFERGGDISAAPLGIARAAALFEAINAARPIGPLIDRYPSPPPRAGPAPFDPYLSPARTGRAGRRRRADTRARLASTSHRGQSGRTELAGHGADVPDRRGARGRPDRGGRTPLRIRSSAEHVSSARGASGSTTPANREGPVHPAGPDGGGVFGIGDLRVLEKDASAPFLRRGRGGSRHRQPALGEIRRPQAIAPAGPSRRVRPQPPARAKGHSPVRSRQPVHGRRRGERSRLRLVRRRGRPHWSSPSRYVDFFDAKGVVEGICEAVGLEAQFTPTRGIPRAGPRRRRAGARPILGVVGKLVPAIAEARGFPAAEDVFVAELDLRALTIAGEGAIGSSIRCRATLPLCATSRCSSTKPCRRHRSWHYPIVGSRPRWFRSSNSIATKGRACRMVASASLCDSPSARSIAR